MILHPERLLNVHPSLVHYVQDAAHSFAHDFDVAVVSGVRTEAQQAALYAQGRSVPGRIVTYAKHAADTAHGRGAAVDLCPVVKGKWLWEAVEDFTKLGRLAEAQGLTWGGRWEMRDLGHVQVLAWRSLPFPPEPEPAP